MTTLLWSDIAKCANNPSMPKKEERTTLFFSATFPQDVRRSASEYLKKVRKLFVHFQKLFPMATAVWKFHTISRFFLRGVCYIICWTRKIFYPYSSGRVKGRGKRGYLLYNCGTRKIFYPYSSGRVKGKGNSTFLIA